jgi:hypothetical protein
MSSDQGVACCACSAEAGRCVASGRRSVGVAFRRAGRLREIRRRTIP